MRKPILKKYIIERNSPCPCRSGKKFKRCCQLTLGSALKNNAFILYDEKKYAQALTAFRAALTQYVIWYNEHTAPFVKDRPAEADSLLLIDIEAVYSYVNGISWCLEYLQKNEIDIFLEKATDIIRDVRFGIYIATLRAIWLANDHNENIAKEILRPLVTEENIMRIPETEFGLRSLEIIQDFLFNELTLSCNFLITDKLLDKASNSIDKVGHFTKKALIYFVYLDNKSSLIFINKAIEKIKEIELEKINSPFELFTIARAYRIKDLISKNNEYHLKVIEIYQKLASLCENNGILLSEINYSISQIFFDLGDFEKTKKYLDIAYKIQPSSEIILDFAKVYIKIENFETVSKYLNMIDFEKLEENLKIDYLTCQAEFALQKNDIKHAKEIELALSRLDITIPLFKEFRNNIRIILLDFLSNKKEKKTLIYMLRDFISRYFILQPNIFGIGININQIIAPKESKK